MRADLVLFPEASLTGLTNNDDPHHDLKLGVSIPGPETARLAAAAKHNRIWVSVGLLEQSQGKLCDSALLIAADGQVRLKYRRISSGWHGADASKRVYGRGRTLRITRTPFGSVIFLICGDLFDTKLVERVRMLHPNWVIVPLARSFDDGYRDQTRWNREEEAHYFRQVRRCGAGALLVNALDRQTRAFGGAWAVSSHGRKVASVPLGRPGILIADLPTEGTGDRHPISGSTTHRRFQIDDSRLAAAAPQQMPVGS